MNEFDPWKLSDSGGLSDDHGEDAFKTEVIENVEPLDRQFGVQPKKSVPDALRNALFGGDADAVMPMHTYAILDAAKVANLPELLESSSLEHDCLFKGDAYEEMKNAAPWIVRLEDRNDFIRRLFTGPEGINGLWDKEPGIYVRSRGTLDDMWRHFRKFTRVEDEQGVWRFFRFWDGELLLGIPRNRLTPIIPADKGVLVLRGRKGRWYVVRQNASSPARSRFILDTRVKSSIEAGVSTHFATAVAQKLRQVDSRNLGDETHSAAAREYLAYANACGLTDRKKQRAFLGFVSKYGYGFMHDVQYPVLKGVLEASRDNPAYKLNLLKKWDDFIGETELDLKRAIDRLGTALGDYNETEEPTSRFSRLNAAKAETKTVQAWRNVIKNWKEYYRRCFPSIGVGGLDRLCLVAFALGQYFHLDPCRNAFVDIGEGIDGYDVTLRNENFRRDDG